MRETALSSLKALGLDAHQAVLAAHSDKHHLHVHMRHGRSPNVIGFLNVLEGLELQSEAWNRPSSASSMTALLSLRIR